MNNPLRTLAVSTLLASAMALTATFSASAGDAVAGEKVFKRCKACHTVGPDAKNKVGPQLNGIVGRAAGVAVDYKYGTGIIEARGEIGDDANGDGYLDVAEGSTGLVWTEETLFGYLEDPKKYIRAHTGNENAKVKMTLKLKKEDQRKDVITYLKTIGLDGNPAAE